MCSSKWIALSAAFFPAVVHADFDISPSVKGGKIVTNAYTDEGPSADNNYQPFVSNVRVFDFGFDDLGPPPSTQDPGFHPRPGSGFTTASDLSVGAASTLGYYGGTGPIAFTAAPAVDSFVLQYGTKSATIGSITFSSTLLTLGSPDAGSNGEFDRHLQSTLVTSDGSTPADGLYLFQLRVYDPRLGLTPSDPAYILFSVNADDAVDDTKVYLRDTFAPGTNLAPAPPVPEPASLSAAAMVGLLGTRRREQ